MARNIEGHSGVNMPIDPIGVSAAMLGLDQFMRAIVGDGPSTRMSKKSPEKAITEKKSLTKQTQIGVDLNGWADDGGSIPANQDDIPTQKILPVIVELGEGADTEIIIRDKK